jgi:tryptophan halogenase
LIKVSSESLDKSLNELSPSKISFLIKTLVDEIISLNRLKGKCKYIDHIKLFNKKNNKEKQYIFPFFEDSSRENTIVNKESYGVLKTQWLASKEQIKKRTFFSNSFNESKDSYSSVGVIGGGTSGYLTALSLKKKHPNLKVSLIESSKIPIIGVGEATTPNIIDFLFNTLGFNKEEFFEKVKPTCKLGIKFDWGLPETYYNFPFGSGDLLASQLYHGNVNSSSLSSILMSNNSSLVIGEKGNKNEVYESLTDSLYHAYHINNKDFVKYLKKKAKELKIELIDDLILECSKNELGDINTVKGENRNYEYDFYVDCTGFKSLLLEKMMGSKFISYADALYTDCAITARMSNQGIVKPYTHSDTMNNGWCWNTPVRDSDHLGYVFSKKYCTENEAIEELRKKHPTAEILNAVYFKSGRHEKILVGNVYAVGNSFAFVEPLESTGIHMIIKEINYLVDNFNEIKKSTVIREVINEDISNHWDYLKFFLAIHFKYNKKLATPFWKDCNRIDLKEYNWVIDLYKKCGPLNYLDPKTKKVIRKRLPDSLFGLGGIDCILMGQSEFPENFKGKKINEKIWHSNINIWKEISKKTIKLVDGDQFLIR